MSRLDRMIAFDPASGWLRCEAGVTIADIAATFFDRGFFPPVVPGTKFVTVAGALASDIHGKNHHVAGSWSNHVRAVEVLLTGGEVVACDRENSPELFRATAGGQGLTGIILAMDVRLEPAGRFVEMESMQARNLDDLMRLSDGSGGWPYTVGWIDGTARGRYVGRGVFMRGRFPGAGLAKGAGASERASGEATGWTQRRSPVDGRLLSFNWLLNPLSMRAFNTLYYLRQTGTRRRQATLDDFFFPLDAVPNWNYMYGPRGFVQYQFVVPSDPRRADVQTVLETVAGSGIGAFLGVIKEFGPQAGGGLSFPIAGTTVALDFPNTGTRLMELLERLDELVAGAGGRVYLAKDARLGRDAFRRMYPDWQRWKAVRDRYDPDGTMQSELGRRLGLVGV
jgi:FAD/FMN-containing dehydrogenase